MTSGVSRRAPTTTNADVHLSSVLEKENKSTVAAIHKLNRRYQSNNALIVLGKLDTFQQPNVAAGENTNPKRFRTIARVFVRVGPLSG